MLPLEGIRVIDMTRAQMGPYCGQLLAEYGADVIKVEAREGEFLRSATRHWDRDGIGSYFLALNRSKRGLALDFKKEKGREVICKLAEKADVLIENYTPGVLESYNLGYGSIVKHKPDIIYCHVSAYGRRGPLQQEDGYDLIMQGETGIMYHTGYPGSPPSPVMCSLIDMNGAALLLSGILMALRVRDNTGEGQEVEVSLLSSAFSLQTLELTCHLTSGRPLPRGGRGIPVNIGLYRIFQASDRWLVLAGVGEMHWRGLCKALGVEYLLADPRFALWTDREKNIDELIALLDSVFLTRPAGEWIGRLRQEGVKVGAVLSQEEMLDNPVLRTQIEENGNLVELELPKVGRINVPGIPIHLSKTPGRVRHGPPEIGEHSHEILTELGYSWEEIAQLVAGEVI